MLGRTLRVQWSSAFDTQARAAEKEGRARKVVPNRAQLTKSLQGAVDVVGNCLRWRTGAESVVQGVR